MEKKWVVRGERKDDLSIVEQILRIRGFGTDLEISDFLSPKNPCEIELGAFGIKETVVDGFTKIIRGAIGNGSPIIIHGDYDVDGICATAILWEAIYKDLGYKRCLPYIPDRFSEGYGLSKASVEGVLQTRFQIDPNAKEALLITADSGISAFGEIEYARGLGLGVVVIDHHQKKETLPKADAIVWTDKLCAAGIAWFLARSLCTGVACNAPTRTNGLDLAALAIIADLQPLLGANRSLVKYGLEEINKTNRAGLRELVSFAGLSGKKIGTYEVGWILAPRLNASGRLENALISLRLLCTDNVNLAREIARKLNEVNAERQKLTFDSYKLAKEQVGGNIRQVLVVSHESYHEGIVGLVAGKLAQDFYRPAIAISIGEKISRGSARSIVEFNIIEAIRQFSDLLIDVGGHPMAAGFSIKTARVTEFTERMIEYSSKVLPSDLSPKLEIDLEISLLDITRDLWQDLTKMEPFGTGNPRPTFLIRGLEVVDVRAVGGYGDHLKMIFSDGKKSIPAIWFGKGNMINSVKLGERVDVAAHVSENEFNDTKKLELQIKDLRSSES